MAESLGITEATFTFDKLIADNAEFLTKGVTVLSGEGTFVRGELLAKIVGSTIAAAVAGSNTGTGTVGSLTASRWIKSGTYTLKCVEAVTNSGIFNVINPNGVSIGMATVASAFTSGEINFTISDATDFVVGDSFTIAVSGTGKYQKYSVSNTDGSGDPRNIVIASVAGDATSADLATTAYVKGVFNSAALTGYVAADEAALNDIGIYIKTNQSVA